MIVKTLNFSSGNFQFQNSHISISLYATATALYTHRYIVPPGSRVVIKHRLEVYFLDSGCLDLKPGLPFTNCVANP